MHQMTRVFATTFQEQHKMNHRRSRFCAVNSSTESGTTSTDFKTTSMETSVSVRKISVEPLENKFTAFECDTVYSPTNSGLQLLWITFFFIKIIRLLGIGEYCKIPRVADKIHF